MTVKILNGLCVQEKDSMGVTILHGHPRCIRNFTIECHNCCVLVGDSKLPNLFMTK